ncbi:hypothetical protein EBB07_23055 [Paenibacillaceae bacterium]|nr:hypothetical protein EBB07_23055 [Paenibacillaceae bacterium]
MFNNRQLLLIILTLAALIAAGIVWAETRESNSETIETIEAFSTELFDASPDDQGIYQKTGYQVVNSKTIIVTTNGEVTSSKITAITDYYDLQQDYMKTVISINDAVNKSYSGIFDADSKSREINEPLNEKPEFDGSEFTAIKTPLSSDQKRKIAEKLEKYAATSQILQRN